MITPEQQEALKIKKDLVEIEDLVSQMLFFSHNSDDPSYVKVLVTNMSKKILEYLQIEHDDISHLFKHEIDHHNYDVHVVNKRSDHIHTLLVNQNKRIKSFVAQVPQLCNQYASNKLLKQEFVERMEHVCSEILKICGSEDHELSFVKDFMKPAEGSGS